jgi:hypothetical protein
MTASLPHPRIGATTTDLAWRVLALVNLYRLLVPVLLAVLYLSITPPPVGQTSAPIFLATAGLYFIYAVISIAAVKRRWPEIALQTFVNAFVDIVAISLLTYASGGMPSGLGALLVLPIGAASFIVRQELALFFAAIATLAMLTQQG